MDAKKKWLPYKMRALKNHALFGTEQAKNHMFLDEKWNPSSRLDQFRYMCEALKKHENLIDQENRIFKKKQKQRLNILKKECREGRIKLKTAFHGDAAKIRKILQDHKDMQSLYQLMPTNLVLENMKEKSFLKTKKHDELLHRKQQLSKKYEEKLLELAELQDRVKYNDQFPFEEEIKVKECRKDLKNSETRLKAAKVINRAYKYIVAALMKDSIYYENILRSLEKDIYEQTAFISQITFFGLSAMGDLKKLNFDYNKLELQTKRRMQERIKNLVKQRNRVANANEEARQYIRNDSDFDVSLNRYDRETGSMLNLKAQLEDVENIMKQVKRATLCVTEEQVYPSMVKQVKDIGKLHQTITKCEKENEVLGDKQNRAKAMKESLEHNLSPEDIKRQNKIQELKKKIAEQNRIANECSDHMKQGGANLCLIRTSLHQFSNVLRHVGETLGFSRKGYPDSDLKLPLLKFDAFAPKTYPPLPYEEDIDKLLNSVKNKVQELMSVYKEEKPPGDLDDGFNEYHDAYLKSIAEPSEPSDKLEALPSLLDGDRGDPMVPTRQQIKALSLKIVEEKLKEQE